MKQKAKALFLIILLFSSIFCLKVFAQSCSALIGKVIEVRGYDALKEFIYVGITQEDIKEYVDATIAKDLQGIFGLISSERVMAIPIGTKVRILRCDDYRGLVKVRILQDEEFAGEVGWTYTKMVLGEK